MKIYLVGGAVRDKLLGLEPKDKDYVIVGATEAQMLELGYKKVGADFPVFLHPVTGEEYALARKERKVGVGYHGFVTEHDTSVTLEDDLARRDLTINSMAMDLETGELFDPFSGACDLREGVLRHTSNAFSEDPLRVVRLARFAARYTFSVAPETIEAAKFVVESGELAHISDERMWKEVTRAMGEVKPSIFFHVLFSCDAFNGKVPFLSGLFIKPPSSDPRSSVMHQVYRLMETVMASIDLNSLTPNQVLAVLVADQLSKVPSGTFSEELELHKLADRIAFVREHNSFDNGADLVAVLSTTGMLKDEDMVTTTFGSLLLDELVGNIPEGTVERLMVAREAALTVKGQQLLDEGFSGRELGLELYQRRVAVVTEALQ